MAPQIIRRNKALGLTQRKICAFRRMRRSGKKGITSTGIHCADKLKAGRIDDPRIGPHHGDLAGLQRLAQGIEDLGMKLRQLVEEKHAVMGQRAPPPTMAAMEAEWCGAR